jgi:hypothetical protein
VFEVSSWAFSSNRIVSLRGVRRRDPTTPARSRSIG